MYRREAGKNDKAEGARRAFVERLPRSPTRAGLGVVAVVAVVIRRGGRQDGGGGALLSRAAHRSLAAWLALGSEVARRWRPGR